VSSGQANQEDANRPTNPDLISRVDRCGLSDREVEKRVPLPTAFLSKARKGGGAGGKAADSWRRLRSWLDSVFPEAVASSPLNAFVQSSMGADLDAFAHQIEASRSMEELEAVGRKAEVLLVRGLIPQKIVDSLAKLLHQRRMAIESKLEYAAKATGSKPVEVEIQWSTACPHCGKDIGDWAKPQDPSPEDEEPEA
jgi:hypothetical protein